VSVMKNLPHFCRGEVVRGFGRGSKELGIPTANFPDSVVDHLPADICTGIYYGWACVGNGDVHRMVMSIGWNPYYKNTKKSMETHIIHRFKEDFYGEILSIVIVGYIRPEKSFDSLANFPDSVVDHLPADICTGIYYGWACVGNGDVHRMVMSIGWNPYYKNTKKSMETHIIHRFKEDFYGEILSIVIVGYIRPEKSFDSLVWASGVSG
ncbi:UNVERIFIED_CONTAM: hypothetical protein FKN15_031151, partial [Acipenser sinensis]